MDDTLSKKTFLGFGLGAVQSGLMLYEAIKSGNFDNYFIIEVNNKIIESVRKNGNKIIINIAKKDRVIKSSLSGFKIFNPNDPADYKAICNAINQADEIATAVPSTEYYDIGKKSLAKLLAENINPKKPQVLYAAENNNYAAEILFEKVLQYTDEDNLRQFQIVNTVIGKMGGVIFDEKTVSDLNLEWMTPYSKLAILVEEFNNIIISKIELPNFVRGIEVFSEKDDLLPFEEAKLFGHNAVHAMLGFFAALNGYTYMSEIRNNARLYQYGINCFINESGAFLLKKYKNLTDSLFTETGFKEYSEDLLERMTNPYLRDEVKRICRDPLRNLEFNDRLFGTIREALKQKVHTAILAKAVIAAIYYIIMNNVSTNFVYPNKINKLDEENVKEFLKNVWLDDFNNIEADEMIVEITSVLDDFKEEFIN